MIVAIKSPGFFMLNHHLLRCHRPPLIRPATRVTTLMPRVVPSKKVFSINIDPEMEWWRQQQRQQQGANHELNGGTWGNELRLAMHSGNLGALKVILKNKPELIASQDDKGWTPLSYASYEGDISIVRYLLKKFPKSTSKPNKDGSFPIHRACIGGHIEVLKMFSSKLLSQSDRYGRTILHLAAKEPGDRLKHVVSYLMNLSEGRKLLEKKDENRWTPLAWANHMNNHGVVEILNRRMR